VAASIIAETRAVGAASVPVPVAAHGQCRRSFGPDLQEAAMSAGPRGREENPPIRRLGVVSFLNAQPLVEGLDVSTGCELIYDVPARLPGLLNAGRVEAALVPVIDLARYGETWRIVSDACIGSEEETLTVRVFSRVPPEQITLLSTDSDSHTSVVLAMLLWNEMYGTALRIRPLGPESIESVEAVLLIGDKVVTQRPEGFAHEIDLGGAWRSWTGLPFVFAVWARRADRDPGDLAELLSAARDRGVARADQIAARCGPALGWPVDLARRYLTEHLSFRLTPRHRQAIDSFLDLSARWGLVPVRAEAAGV